MNYTLTNPPAPMSPTQTFSAIIELADGGGAFVTVPFDVEPVFGRKRVPIRATFDGVPYRGTLVRMGESRHLLIIRKEIREQIGKGPGDVVHVTLEEDPEPRVVTLPEDFRAALHAHPDAEARFGALSYTHRKEYVRWIEEAKREATRRRRIEKSIEMLAAGQKPR